MGQKAARFCQDHGKQTLQEGASTLLLGALRCLGPPPPHDVGARGAGLEMTRPFSPPSPSCAGEQLPVRHPNVGVQNPPKVSAGTMRCLQAWGERARFLQGQAGLGHPSAVMFVSTDCVSASGREAGASSVVVTPSSALGSDAAAASTMEILQRDRLKDAGAQM